MEVGLWDFDGMSFDFYRLRVLILVLMEVGLWETWRFGWKRQSNYIVLILVLMEVGLWGAMKCKL